MGRERDGPGCVLGRRPYIHRHVASFGYFGTRVRRCGAASPKEAHGSVERVPEAEPYRDRSERDAGMQEFSVNGG